MFDPAVLEIGDLPLLEVTEISFPSSALFPSVSTLLPTPGLSVSILCLSEKTYYVKAPEP